MKACTYRGILGPLNSASSTSSFARVIAKNFVQQLREVNSRATSLRVPLIGHSLAELDHDTVHKDGVIR